jgi:hypothetical protein
MLWSPRAKANKFAAIQDCLGTWLEKPKGPYMSILNPNVGKFDGIF